MDSKKLRDGPDDIMRQAFGKLAKVDSQILENVDFSCANQVSHQFELWCRKLEIIEQACQLIGKDDELKLAQLKALKMDVLEPIVKTFVPHKKLTTEHQIEILKNSVYSTQETGLELEKKFSNQ